MTGPGLRQVRRAGLVAGVTLLVIAISAPFGEFYAMPRLWIDGTAADVVANITAHRRLLVAGIFGYLIAFTGDVVLAWALYVFLAATDRDFSLLTAWFRVVYALIALVALLNLVNVWELTGGADHLAGFGADVLDAQVMAALDAFGSEWSLGFGLFGIYLLLLGVLTIRARYVPTFLGILLLVSGFGYLLDPFLKPFLFPHVDTGLLVIAYLGELVFMVWLLGWSWRIASLEPGTGASRA